MGVIKKGDLVLVTGASGFIAAQTVREFLKRGYRVRGTVRSEGKGDYLKKLFMNEGEFEYVIVEDIITDGAFDKAVDGVDAVAHLASPFYIQGVKDPQELIGPAVKGTTGILQSIQTYNPGIKRVVVTSSTAAVGSIVSNKSPHIYTEEDWNHDSVPHVEQNGLKSNAFHSYLASKTLAEKAVWSFVQEQKPSWDVVTLCPPFVYGEAIQQISSPEQINTSVAAFFGWLSGQKTEANLSGRLGDWVNVKDIALAHVLALEVPEASNERFIISAGRATDDNRR
ncbi:hypothetical protein IAU60_004642 [Kwoniella sp. DSM 27419]